jgi:imidazolonepropionase-like amidohydrolase
MPDTITVFTNATLVDGTGAQPREHATVVVQGDRIAEVTSGDQPYRGQAADSVDCTGRTLVPGLIDAHVHAAAIDVNILEQHRVYPPSLAALHTARLLSQTLAQGFTTVRDAGGADRGFADAVEEGLVHGPRLLVSGAPVSQTGGHGDPRRRTEHAAPSVYCPAVGMRSVVADGVDEVRKAVREQLRTGAHQIKVMASGGAMSPTDELDTTQYSVDELRAAVDEATAAGTYVLAHAYSSAAVRNCIAAGVRSVEHGNLIDAETARALAEAGTFLVPTLVTYDALARDGADYGVPAANIAKINEAREQGLAGLRHAAEAGVRIGSGSDLLGPLQVHKARELILKAQVLGPLGALVAATRTNAELLGLADELGTIEAGKAADLLVVDGDLFGDLGLLTDPAKLEVFKSGRRPPSPRPVGRR